MYYFSVYDRKAECFSVLSPAVNEEVYIRGLVSALLSNPSSMFVQYPEDYEIVCIGDFDEETGFFDTEEYPGYGFERMPMMRVVERMRELIGRSEKSGSDENVSE